MCIQRVCTSSPLVPADECPFDDNLISGSYFQNTIPSIASLGFLTCQEAFSHITQNNRSISGYCDLNSFRERCCRSCKSKIEKLTI